MRGRGVVNILLDGELAAAMAAHGHVRRRHPSRWWRYNLAQDYDRRTVCRIRSYLAKFEVLGDTQWFDAASGDAVAAIGMAFKYRPLYGHGREFDLAMTALAISALQGSSRARLWMWQTLRWLPDAAEAEIRVADSWLMLAFAAKSARRNLDPSA
jgi:hypothetical protein